MFAGRLIVRYAVAVAVGTATGTAVTYGAERVPISTAPYAIEAAPAAASGSHFDDWFEPLWKVLR